MWRAGVEMCRLMYDTDVPGIARNARQSRPSEEARRSSAESGERGACQGIWSFGEVCIRARALGRLCVAGGGGDGCFVFSCSW